MTSEVPSVKTPASSLVQGSHATQVLVNKSGNALPPSGNTTAAVPVAQQAVKPLPAVASASATAASTQARAIPAKPTAAKPATQKSSTQSQIASLNKALNDSGQPARFRASPDDKDVEEVNPVSGEVVAVYPADEFAALAKSVGIPGVLVNEIV